MKTIAKIVWKDEPSYYWCGGSAPVEKATLTLTRDEIQFKRAAQMNDYLGDECPISQASESWKVKVKHPNYPECFETIAKTAEEVVNGGLANFVCDGPIQSLIVYYDDGTKAKMLNQCSFLLEESFLREQLSDFLPERMSQAIFGEPEEDNEQP